MEIFSEAVHRVIKYSHLGSCCEQMFSVFAWKVTQTMHRLSLIFCPSTNWLIVWAFVVLSGKRRPVDLIMHVTYDHYVLSRPSLSFSFLIKPRWCHQRQRGWVTAKQQELLYRWWAVKCSGRVSNRPPSAAKTSHHPRDSMVGGASRWHTGVLKVLGVQRKVGASQQEMMLELNHAK